MNIKTISIVSAAVLALFGATGAAAWSYIKSKETKPAIAQPARHEVQAGAKFTELPLLTTNIRARDGEDPFGAYIQAQMIVETRSSEAERLVTQYRSRINHNVLLLVSETKKENWEGKPNTSMTLEAIRAAILQSIGRPVDDGDDIPSVLLTSITFS